MLRSNLKSKPQLALIKDRHKEKKDNKLQALDFYSTTSKKAGIQYLEATVTNCGYQSIIGSDRALSDSKPSPVEVFTSMLALDLHMKCCQDYSFVAKLITFLTSWHQNGIFHFFQDQELLPADIDSTSVGLSILFETNKIDRKILDDIVDKILENTNNDGIIQVYFDRDRPRIDPIVCINALYLINLANKHEEKAAKATEYFIFDLLVKREYKNHLRYYISEEQFLYFLSRLINRFPGRYDKFIPLLKNEIADKMGRSVSPLNLAMRAIASHHVNIENTSDIIILQQLQSQNGNWEADAFFKYGRSEKYFGCKELTTAFALKAIEQDEKIVPLKFSINGFFAKRPISKSLAKNSGIDVTDEEMVKSHFGQGSNTASKISKRATKT